MLDINILRKNPLLVKEALKHRHYPGEAAACVDEIKQKDEEWRKIKKEEEDLRAERNKLNIEIIQLKKSGESAEQKIKRSGAISKRIKQITEEEKLEEQIRNLMLTLPNLPHISVPYGAGEKENKEIRKHGTPSTGYVMDHHDLGERTEWIDFEGGAKLAGHRFAFLKGPLAKLERALINFMLSVHALNDYEEVIPPFMVSTKMMVGTGQLPKFESEQYKCRDDDLWLIPTAEVPLINLFSGEVLEEKKLPVKITAYSPCFRREAGAYGKDIRGLLRQHQFNKVELVKIAHPEKSFVELESLAKDAEKILLQLELPYRVVELCTGDLGFASAKTYDLEVWIPSQKTYREISSCSNCTDFQARRANIKFRNAKGELQFVHTLNGSGLAVGRTMIAILENFQDGNKIIIPKVLHDFMGCEELEF